MKKMDAYRVYLALSASIGLINMVIFTVNSVYQVTMAHLNPLQLVLVGTVLEASVFLFEVPTGVVADVFSRRLSIIVGMFLIGLGFLLEGAIPLFGAILIAQVFWGVGFTFTSGATQAWISDEIGEENAGTAFLRGSQVDKIAALAGIGISVWLAGIRVNVPIMVGGGLYILLGIFLLLTMPETGFTPTPQEERNSWQNMAHTFRGGVKMLRIRPALLTILSIGLVYGLYSEGFDRLWTKHLLDSFTFPSLFGLQPVAWFGVINAVGLLLTAGATEIVHRRLDLDNSKRVIRALMVISAILVASLVAFAQVNSFALVLIAFWIIYITRRVIDPLYTTWVNQRLDSRVRATVLSMSSQVDAIGQIAGGPILGVVGKAVSVQAAITLTGVILSPVLVLYGRAIRRFGETEDDLTAKLDPRVEVIGD